MPRISQEAQLQRELRKLGVEQRLKGAPLYHWWALGPERRAQSDAINSLLSALSNREAAGEALSSQERQTYTHLQGVTGSPGLDPYSVEMRRADQKLINSFSLALEYHYEESWFVLHDVPAATEHFLAHFYPIGWPELDAWSPWELVREVIPALRVAKISLLNYEQQRWLYDETSQRAAEMLAFRVTYSMPNHCLPERLRTTIEQRAVVGEYENRLSQGTHPRRWIQEQWSRVQSARSTKKSKKADNGRKK